MNQKTEKDSAGKALYLEFHKGMYVCQIIVTPSVVGLDNKVIPSLMMRRAISPSHPRKTWSNFRLLGDSIAQQVEPKLERDSDGEFIRRSLTEVSETFVNNLSYNSVQVIRDVSRNGWTLHKTPIVVEASYLEVSQAFRGTTPNSLVRRVTRARTALGWGDLFSVEPASV